MERLDAPAGFFIPLLFPAGRNRFPLPRAKEVFLPEATLQAALIAGAFEAVSHTAFLRTPTARIRRYSEWLLFFFP